MRRTSDGILLVLLVGVAACSGGSETGPGEVRWDKDVCARCLMAVGDRHFSAQVRGGPAGGRSRLHHFDDLGCAVLWLAERDWAGDARTEIWVNDCETGAWLEARSAFFAAGHITPMDYGLGAYPEPGEGRLDYAAAARAIIGRDAGRRSSGGDARSGEE